MFGALCNNDANIFIAFYYVITVVVDDTLYELLTEQFYHRNSWRYSCMKHVERNA